MKKIIISLVIIASFVLVACGGGKSDKKAEVEKMLLQGHSWGETENEVNRSECQTISFLV